MTWTLLIVPLLGALLIDASRSTSTTSSTSTTMSSSPTGSTLSLSSTQPPKVTSTKTPLQLLKPIHVSIKIIQAMPTYFTSLYFEMILI
ncbi:uncharacterized protein LOC121367498 isoform X4 [Gigantopelta aegis]|uniref:uncharacterized protein LOC121367498 isoform X4 n=1 Tax=Gigantopelta aegis TaxID=1735272 RepID=UPI001B88D0E5|nr:uncharacterized protein LOC121367498 isoform X4 [Gigantopelta aegis]XP_041347640.1 uncharacterized protein LOC121367498 isoform X4 [Gigantopelta aegis]